MEFTIDAARVLLLAAQGLVERPAQPASKDDVLAAIQRMSALQIDTINVVARSHLLVLWSRIGGYEPRWLDELLAEARIFEYWAHAACFLPIEDFPLYRRRMLDGLDRSNGWFTANPEVVDRVLGHVRDHGAVRSADFERQDKSKGGWWQWKPEKQALEHLYHVGALMIARREKFQRVYDLRERVLPHWHDDRAPTSDEVRRMQTLRAVRALGVARPRWVPNYFQTSKQGAAKWLEKLASEGALIRASVADWDGPAYVHPDNRALARAVLDGKLPARRTTLLSPFDPVIWDRNRARELFDFDYRIETYTPAERRQYGYFTLPILHRRALVGRLDPKLDRKAKRLIVRAAHLEPEVTVADGLLDGLADALRDLASFLGASEITVERSEPVVLAPALRERLG